MSSIRLPSEGLHFLPAFTSIPINLHTLKHAFITFSFYSVLFFIVAFFACAFPKAVHPRMKREHDPDWEVPAPVASASADPAAKDKDSSDDEDSSKGAGPVVPHVKGLPIFGSYEFFTRRHRFVLEELAKKGPMYSFNVSKHKVTVLSGEEARACFFGRRDIGFSEGYRILFGNIPSLQSIHVQDEKDKPTRVWFMKRLSMFQQKEYFAKIFPRWIDDLDRTMRTWGDRGTLDPFNKLYNLVFQLEIRACACREIADDPAAVQHFQDLYWTTEHGAMASVLAPWLPLPARVRKFRATVELYLILKRIVSARKAEGRSEDDATQMMMDRGDGPYQIVHFVISLLFAGIFSTGIMTCWLPFFLYVNPEYKAKIMNEIQTILDKHSPSLDSDETPLTRLARVPPHALESEMPVFDACLRETIRMCMSGTFLRRALVDDIEIGGHKIEIGSFMAYPVADAHLNPEYYPDPLRWDPTRFERGEGKDTQWSFLGWGVGAHPCMGMPLAKLVMKTILITFFITFNYDLVDPKGNIVTTLPPPDRDDLHKTPPIKPVYMKYTRRFD